jgi:hypothetical protein
MNAMENFYIQMFQQEGTLIQEQNSGEENPLCKIIIHTQHKTHAPKQDTDVLNTTTTKQSVTATPQDTNNKNR